MNPNFLSPFKFATNFSKNFVSLKVCDNDFLSVRDFGTNPHRIFAAHELMAMIDPATTTKMTVQFNLFGGTVFRLGTERHHHLLDGIDTLADIGCFGLTELGFGNNAVEMETTGMCSY